MSSHRKTVTFAASTDGPPQRRPAFYTGWRDVKTGEFLVSEVGRPWLNHWSPEELRWMFVSGEPEPQPQPQPQPQQRPASAIRAAQPQPQPQPQPLRAQQQAQRVDAAPSRSAPPGMGLPSQAVLPPAPQPAQPSVTFELAAGSRISLQAAPQGAAVSLEATPQGTLLLHLALPPNGKLAFGLGAGAAAPPPAPVAPGPTFSFNPPEPAMQAPVAAGGSQGQHSVGSPPSAPAPGAGPVGAAAQPPAAFAFDTAAAAPHQPAGTQEADGDSSGDAAEASQEAFSLAVKDGHWDQPELPPDWHLTVSQGGWLLRTIRLDASAAAALRIRKASRAVVLEASDVHSRLVVRLGRREWRAALQLLRRAVTETVSGRRLWSQQGSGLLRPKPLPGAAAALATAKAQVAGSEGADGSGADAANVTGAQPAAESGEPAAASPAGLLHELRAAAPAECVTAQPPAAKRLAAGVVSPRRSPTGVQPLLAQLAELQQEAGEVAAGTSTD